jgi:CRISPR/Cas system CSM-associated protein Csm5 (group 7 of RAMP superfamily)
MRFLQMMSSLAFFALVATSLHAQQFSYEEANQGFKTPSGNIVCLSAVAMQNGKEDIPIIDCRISKVDQWTVREASCSQSQWDKFNGFSIEHKAQKVRLSCNESNYNEIVTEQKKFGLFKNGLKTLGYGETWSLGTVSCSSDMNGLTCRNKEGHGFFLSRKSQSIF